MSWFLFLVITPKSNSSFISTLVRIGSLDVKPHSKQAAQLFIASLPRQFLMPGEREQGEREERRMLPFSLFWKNVLEMFQHHLGECLTA